MHEDFSVPSLKPSTKEEREESVDLEGGEAPYLSHSEERTISESLETRRDDSQERKERDGQERDESAGEKGEMTALSLSSPPEAASTGEGYGPLKLQWNYEKTFGYMQNRRTKRRYMGTYKKYSWMTRSLSYVLLFSFLAALVGGIIYTRETTSETGIPSDLTGLGRAHSSVIKAAIFVVCCLIFIYLYVRYALVIRWCLYWFAMAWVCMLLYTEQLQGLFYYDDAVAIERGESLSPKDYKLVRDITWGILGALEGLTILIYFLTHSFYPYALRTHRLSLSWWFSLSRGRFPNELTYVSRAWLGFKERRLVTYVGGVDREGRPHGFGQWEESSYHGEVLRGWWHHGVPVAPFQSREFGTGYVFQALRVIVAHNRRDPPEKTGHLFPVFLPEDEGLLYGVASVEVSVAGQFFKFLPDVSYVLGGESGGEKGKSVAWALEHAVTPVDYEVRQKEIEILQVQVDHRQHRLFVPGFDPLTEEATTSFCLEIVAKPSPEKREEERVAERRRRKRIRKEDEGEEDDRGFSPFITVEDQRDDENQEGGEDVAGLKSPKELLDQTRAREPRERGNDAANYQEDEDLPLFLRQTSENSHLRNRRRCLPETRSKHPASISSPDPHDEEKEAEQEAGDNEGAIPKVKEQRRNRSPRTSDEEENRRKKAQERENYPHACREAAKKIRRLQPRLHLKGWRPRSRALMEALLFIPGYNVGVNSAAGRLAQMMALADYPPNIIPIMFSWPGGGSSLTYTWARRAAESERMRRDFISLLASIKEAGFTTVHVMTHSMGARVLFNATEALAEVLTERAVPTPRRREDRETGFKLEREKEEEDDEGGHSSFSSSLRLETLTFLNPDYEKEKFIEQDYDVLWRYCDRISIYGDTNDGALSGSETFSLVTNRGKKELSLGRRLYDIYRLEGREERDKAKRSTRIEEINAYLIEEGVTVCEDAIAGVIAGPSISGREDETVYGYERRTKKKKQKRRIRGERERKSSSASSYSSPLLQKKYLDLDVLDTTWLDGNIHSLRHSFHQINRILLEDIRELILTRRRARHRLSPVHRTGNVYTFLAVPGVVEAQ